MQDERLGRSVAWAFGTAPEAGIAFWFGLVTPDLALPALEASGRTLRHLRAQNEPIRRSERVNGAETKEDGEALANRENRDHGSEMLMLVNWMILQTEQK
jgi:hypothetical protein